MTFRRRESVRIVAHGFHGSIRSVDARSRIPIRGNEHSITRLAYAFRLTQFDARQYTLGRLAEPRVSDPHRPFRNDLTCPGSTDSVGMRIVHTSMDDGCRVQRKETLHEQS